VLPLILALGLIALLAALPGDEASDLPDRPGTWFSWRELTHAGRTGASNPETVPVDVQRSLLALTRDVLDPLRDRLARPVIVTSGWRSPAVNATVGGSETSDHMTGGAVDIVVAGLTAQELAAEVAAVAPSWDQIIYYPHTGHVHLGYPASGRRRRDVLEALPGGGYRSGSLSLSIV